MTGSKITRAVYAGSFDPPTNGHLYMIREGARLFDELHLAIGVNPEKQYSFSLAARREFLEEICALYENVTVDSFENRFLVDYAAEIGADALLRGIRNANDLIFERTMRNVNSDMNPGITSVFLMPPRELTEISSSFVRGLVGPVGWEKQVARFVPKTVLEALVEQRAARG